MTVTIDRKYKKETYTIGIVSVDGVRFSECIEDRDRGLTQAMPLATITSRKVYGETAIPAGTYQVRMTYSNRFKRIMPEVLNVPGFSGIRIHSGNTAKDSLGCILLGKNDKVGWVSNSRATCQKFEQLLNKAGGTCTLNII